jgi:hypothetical protein
MRPERAATDGGAATPALAGFGVGSACYQTAMRKLHTLLGSRSAVGTTQITLFIPSVDRDGERIDQRSWAKQALTTLALLFRGATAFPPGRGAWRDDERAGKLVFDDTVLVTSYFDPRRLTKRALAALRAFLHRLGREALQGEVGVVIGSQYHGITEFDEEDA